MKWFILLALFLVACSAIPDSCTGIVDSYEKDHCILTYALEQNVSSSCSSIKNEHWKTWCYTDVASNTNDVAVCDKIAVQSSQEHCVKNVALNVQDQSLCQEIINTPAGDECYRVIAIEQQNAGLCQNIQGQEHLNTCYVEIAEALPDYTLCRFIEQDTQRRDACLFRVTLKENATLGCADIFVPDTRDICYVNHAIKLLDASLCNDIIDERVLNSCKAAVTMAARRAEE